MLNEAQTTPFVLNEIRTSKYGLVNFLPVFLFTMFRRVAYLYFLAQVKFAAFLWMMFTDAACDLPSNFSTLARPCLVNHEAPGHCNFNADSIGASTWSKAFLLIIQYWHQPSICKTCAGLQQQIAGLQTRQILACLLCKLAGSVWRDTSDFTILHEN